MYEPGSVSNLAYLTWYDRSGKELGRLGDPGLFIEVAISPDESKVVAVEFNQANIDLWIYELARGVHTRFTTSRANQYPLWSPDGNTIVYASSIQNDRLSLFRKAVDGNSPPVLLASSDRGLIPSDWSRDGKYIAVVSSTPETNKDMWILPYDGDHKLTPFMQTRFNERSPRFSPDTRWMAYSSDEAGHYEIYVAPFPAGGKKWQVSTAGGSQPLWSRDGTEPFYLSPDNTVMAASVTAGGTEPKIGVPAALFCAHPRNFDYGIYNDTSDGRFLISSAADESTAPLTLISNWPALIKN